MLGPCEQGLQKSHGARRGAAWLARREVRNEERRGALDQGTNCLFLRPLVPRARAARPCYKRAAVDGGSEEVISVAELARRLRRAVEEIAGQWVEGEVSSLKRAGSGHVYFALKDEREDACLDCVMYRFQAQRARRHLVEGSRLQVFGRPRCGRRAGGCSSSSIQVRPAGKGALLEALEQLKLRLAAEGLFASRKEAQVAGGTARGRSGDEPDRRRVSRHLHGRFPARRRAYRAQSGAGAG